MKTYGYKIVDEDCENIFPLSLYDSSQNIEFVIRAIDYIKSLPEFDAEIFEEITGLKIEDK